jgi:hypothetical protein
MALYLFFATVLGLAGTAWAQTSSASIRGQVTDPSGAATPQAKLAVQNTRTGVVVQAETNEQGRYLAPYLPPGLYQVRVERAGFQQFVQGGIELDPQQNLTLDIVLTLGDVASKIEVTAAPAPLTTANATVATTVDNRAVVDLPLNSGNVLALALFTPTANLPQSTSATQEDQWSAALGGGRNASSAVLVDGASINVSDNSGGMSPYGMQPPSVDAVEEFTIQVNALAAEFGRTGGGLIQVATKQGTNRAHGTAREFLRNSAMDANDFFSNRAGVPLKSLQRHRYGFSLGGPVMLPRIFDGRNRTFFFVDYERTRLRTPASMTGTMPLDAWKGGDFSSLRYTNGNAITIYDPITVHPGASGLSVRDAFPGNRIPESRFDPVARNIMKYYPAPNRPSDNRYAEVNNFFGSGTNEDDLQNLTVRLDHNPAGWWRTYTRLNWADRRTNQVDFLGNGATNGGDFRTPRYGAVWDNVLTLNPTTVLNIRYSLSRFFRRRDPLSYGFDLTSLGFPAYVAERAAAESKYFPQIAVTGLTTIGGAATNRFAPTTHSFVATVTKVAGAHTMKAGWDYRKNLLNYWANPQSSPAFTFGATWTQRGNIASTVEGSGFASFLLGVGSGQQTRAPAVAMAGSYHGLYWQDDWRVTKKLTLNFGLRYELDTPRTERYNRLSYFDAAAPSPIAASVRGYPGLRGAMRFVTADNRRQTPADTNNVGPRFGFAYQADASTVVRGGYGTLYDGSPMGVAYVNAGLLGFRATTNMVSSADDENSVPTRYLKNPFPFGYLEPLGAQPGPISGPGTMLGQNINDGYLIDNSNPIIQQWNVTVQRQFPGRMIVEAAYLANKGNHLLSGDAANLQYNQLTPEWLALGDRLAEAVDNPFYGVIQDATSTLNVAKVARRQLLRPYPQYTGLSPYLAPVGNSIYHAFTLRAQKRFSSGVQFLLAFTGAKTICDTEGGNFFMEGASTNWQNVYDRKSERAVSSQDVASRMVMSVTYELPFGPKRRFLAGAHPVVGAVAGGWQINGLMSLQSGLPVPMYQSLNNVGLFTQAQRPNNKGQSAHIEGGTKDARLRQWFDTSVFSIAPAYTFGNAPRVLPDVRQPGIRNFDFSLFKTFRVREDRLRAQFRAEAFNAFNTAQFGRANSTIGAAAAGIITSVAQPPRSLQLALKLLF